MVQTLWRLFRAQYGPGLSGVGGLYTSGRFHNEGEPTAYFSLHPSTAILEILVQFTRESMPDDFELGRFSFSRPVEQGVASHYAENLPEEWWRSLSSTRRVAAEWRRRRDSCLLEVPSVIVPEDSNLVFNPAHPEASLLQLERSRPFAFDARLR